MNGISIILMTSVTHTGTDMDHIIHGPTVHGDTDMTHGTMDSARSIATHGITDTIIMDSMILSIMTHGMDSATHGITTTMAGTTRSITTTIITTLHLRRGMYITVHVRMPDSHRQDREGFQQTEAAHTQQASELRARQGLRRQVLHAAERYVREVRHL